MKSGRSAHICNSTATARGRLAWRLTKRRRAEQHNFGSDPKNAQREIAAPKDICVSADDQRKGQRKRFVLKIARDFGDGRHPSQIDDPALVAPKCARMAGADSNE